MGMVLGQLHGSLNLTNVFLRVYVASMHIVLKLKMVFAATVFLDSHLDNNKASAGCTRNFTVEICKEKYQTYPMEAVANITWENQTDSVTLLTSAQTDCQNACSQDCNCEAALFQDGACSKQRLPLRFGQRTEGNSNVALIKVLTSTPATNQTVPTDQTVPERKKERGSCGYPNYQCFISCFCIHCDGHFWNCYL
jgi:hypothetical protein